MFTERDLQNISMVIGNRQQEVQQLIWEGKSKSPVEDQRFADDLAEVVRKADYILCMPGLK